jgi:hypothetical protein
MQPFALCHLPSAISQLPSPISHLLLAIGYRLFGHGLAALRSLCYLLFNFPSPTSRRGGLKTSDSRLKTEHNFGARNLAGVAGHARRSENK